MAKPIVDMKAAKKLNLSASIETASGGIVSKTLIEDHGVKQILFFMDATQEMSSHSSSFPATVHVLEGKLQFTLEQETFEMNPGDWLMMPSGAKHGLVAITPMRFLLTLFKANDSK